MFLSLLKSVFYVVLIIFMGTFVLSFLSGVVAFFIDILRFRLPHDERWITIEKEKRKCQNQIWILKFLKLLRKWSSKSK